jgi:hypothetical protein
MSRVVQIQIPIPILCRGAASLRVHDAPWILASGTLGAWAFGPALLGPLRALRRSPARLSAPGELLRLALRRVSACRRPPSCAGKCSCRRPRLCGAGRSVQEAFGLPLSTYAQDATQLRGNWAHHPCKSLKGQSKEVGPPGIHAGPSEGPVRARVGPPDP